MAELMLKWKEVFCSSCNKSLPLFKVRTFDYDCPHCWAVHIDVDDFIKSLSKENQLLTLIMNYNERENLKFIWTKLEEFWFPEANKALINIAHRFRYIDNNIELLWKSTLYDFNKYIERRDTNPEKKSY